MDIFTTIANWFHTTKPAAAVGRELHSRPLKRRTGRSYAAAQHTDLTADWKLVPTSPDHDILSALSVVRERARDLMRNNDYAKKASLLFRVNVVGPTGFKFQSNVKEFRRQEDGKFKLVADEEANMKIQEGLREWSKKNHCSVDGRFTFRGIQDQAALGWFRDGEAFIRIVRDPKAKFGIYLQLIEPEAIDETLNMALPNGHVVKMGVELDRWRRPIAYYVRKRKPEQEAYSIYGYSREYEPVPAEEMIHIFDQEFPNQTRGISLLVSSMVSLKMLGGFEEAALIKCRMAASDMGFLVPDKEMPMETTGDQKDEDENEVMDVKPGMFPTLPPGYDIKEWGKDFPTSVYEPFVKTHLHRISAGVGMAYSSLTNDLGETSYSSARVGLLEERELWRLRQQVFIDNFLDPFYPHWLEMAITSNQVFLPMAKFDKFDAPIWVGRRWAWVDPLKDTMGKILEIQAGLETATQVIAEKGGDIGETYQELANEKALAESLGLVLKLDENAGTWTKPANDKDDDKKPNDDKAKRNLLEKEDVEAMDLFRQAQELIAQHKPDQKPIVVLGNNGNGRNHNGQSDQVVQLLGEQTRHEIQQLKEQMIESRSGTAKILAHFAEITKEIQHQFELFRATKEPVPETPHIYNFEIINQGKEVNKSVTFKKDESGAFVGKITSTEG